MTPSDQLPLFLREERAWRRIRGGEPPPVAPLKPGAPWEYNKCIIRDNLRSSASWGSGNRFARRFAKLWRDVPSRPGLSTIAPEFSAHWLARSDVQKERAAWFFRRACKFEDWQKGLADNLPYHCAGLPKASPFLRKA